MKDLAWRGMAKFLVVARFGWFNLAAFGLVLTGFGRGRGFFQVFLPLLLPLFADGSAHGGKVLFRVYGLFFPAQAHMMSKLFQLAFGHVGLIGNAILPEAGPPAGCCPVLTTAADFQFPFVTSGPGFLRRWQQNLAAPWKAIPSQGWGEVGLGICGDGQI